MLIQYLLVFVLAGAFVLTWRRTRQGSLSRVVALLWSALWIAAVVLVLRPDLSSAFAGAVGVGRGVDAVIYVSIILLFYLVFRIFLRLDKIDRDVTSLVRKISLAGRGKDEEGGRPT